MTDRTASAPNAPATPAAAVPKMPPPSRRRVWQMAIRLPTLPAAVGPVLVGLGVALGQNVFRPLPALGALGVAVLFQIAANLANDLFDFRSGADTPDRLGPPRVAAMGLLGQRDLTIGIVVVLALASCVGLYLVTVGGLPILVLGILAALSLLAYTGGPWPYGYHGLGEVFVFVFFGLVAVAGTAYLQTDRFDAVALVAGVAVGAFVTAILVVNNLRDLATDARTGKRTLAVMLGERATVAGYLLLVALAYLVVGLLAVLGWAGLSVVLPLVSLPLAVPLIREVRAGGDPRRLNPVLKGTARLSLIFSVLFALGLALDRVV